MPNVTLTVELTETEALALAQFCKRLGFIEFSQNAINENEAYIMRDAQARVAEALKINGYNPR